MERYMSVLIREIVVLKLKELTSKVYFDITVLSGIDRRGKCLSYECPLRHHRGPVVRGTGGVEPVYPHHSHAWYV